MKKLDNRTKDGVARRLMFVIARGDAFGGSSLHVMDMASRLIEDGHQVRIIIGGEPDMEVPKRFSARGLDFECVESMGREIHPVKDLKALLAIRRAVRSFDPDLVSLHASKAGTLGRLACLGLGIPTFYTPHCWSFVDGFPKAGVFRFLEKLLAPTSTRIISVCEDERRFGLERGVGRADRTLTVHNGVRDRFAEKTERVSSASEPLRIIMVGRFEAQKNQRLLLEVLGNLKSLPWTLTLVGDGPLREECIALANRLGIADRVTFVGYSSEVDVLLRNHDLFALITNWEGFPRSILEAMAAGLPVVVSDVGGSREAVIDGQTGCLVGRDDAAGLEQALRSLIANRDLCQKLGDRGRDRFLERFTFEGMYRRYVELYGKVIAEGRNRRRQVRQLPMPDRGLLASPMAHGNQARTVFNSSHR